MICKKVQYLLTEAQLKGFNYIEIDDKLTDFEIDDIKYCGYNIIFINNKYKVSL